MTKDGDALGLITQLVAKTVDEWNLDLDGDLHADTRLAEDLCFSSVEMLHLLAAVDMRLSTRLPFDRLIIQDGAYRTELTLGELARFVDTHRHAASPA
jgi:acyl carrier protein